MGQPAAKQSDQVVGTDIHVVLIPAPSGSVPMPLPHPFNGRLDGELSPDVNIEGRAAALRGSTASNAPPHVPQGGPFQKQPANSGTVLTGSPTVLVNGKPLARNGDLVTTCNDPTDAPAGTIVATGTVLVG